MEKAKKPREKANAAKAVKAKREKVSVKVLLRDAWQEDQTWDDYPDYQQNTEGFPTQCDDNNGYWAEDGYT